MRDEDRLRNSVAVFVTVVIVALIVGAIVWNMVGDVPRPASVYDATNGTIVDDSFRVFGDLEMTFDRTSFHDATNGTISGLGDARWR